MPFSKGQSGNPKGRTKGSQNKRAALAKLLEPHAKPLIDKMIELALNGDPNALRLCIERLLPKAKRESIPIELPNEITGENIVQITNSIFGSSGIAVV